MEQTTNLELPYIMPSQAQKHVTHNEALRILDNILHLAVVDRDFSAPPPDPAEGARYIVAAGGEGAWAGQDGKIAAWQDGAWAFATPRPGWLAWIIDEVGLFYRTETGWQNLATALAGLQNLALLGIGTTADASNPFAAKVNKALWTAKATAEGGDGDMRFTLNKQAASNVLSLLLQSDYSGRAEIGLVGDDDLSLKVSPDGSNWFSAVSIGRADGTARFPCGIAHQASGQLLHGMMFTPGGDGVTSIWRIDEAHAQNPRTATIASVSGDVITLGSAVAGQFFHANMAGVSYIRVWNITKSPVQSAWLKARPSTSSLQVLSAADIAGWTSGDTLQLGDPTTVTPNRCIAVDISQMQQNLFGTVFRQSGIMVKASMVGASTGDALDVTPTGLVGSFVSCAKVQTGGASAAGGVTVIPCSELSPISDSNLVFVRETATTTATTESIGCVALTG